MRLPSLLDPAPLETNLKNWIAWSAIHRNVRNGVIDSIGIVTTAARTGRTVVFVERSKERKLHRSHVIDYVPAKLADEHVRASAAIPILFPPVRIDKPADARGWYFDGGTRLNTPIKPALDLGANRLVVIGMDAISDPPLEPGRHESAPPDFGDGALHVLHGMLVDPVVEDMRILGNINMFFADRNEPERDERRRRKVDGSQMEARPRGATARRVASRHTDSSPTSSSRPRNGARSASSRATSSGRDTAGSRGCAHRTSGCSNGLIGGESPQHGELLSYLFFDPEFIEELIRMGQQDARRWLEAPPGEDDPWQIGPLEAFTTARPR